MATLIIGRIKPGGPSSDKPDFVQKVGEPGYDQEMPPVGEEKDPSEAGLEAAMEDFIDALHSKDAMSAVAAFKSLFDICDSDDSDDEDEDEEAGEGEEPGPMDIKSLISQKLGK